MRRKLVICDDEIKILKDLSMKIEELQPEKWDIQELDSMDKLRESLEKTIPDLLMLDIKLGNDNGIELACEIQKKCPYLPIIFITGYNEYAQEIFRIRPIYLLIKPFKDDKVYDALVRAEKHIHKCKSSYVRFVSKGNIYNIDCKDIYYAESIRRKIIIVTVDDRYEVYMKMNELLKLLPDNFVYSHKSYIVNMNYIHKISNTEIILSTNKSIPVSRTRYKEVKETFMSFALN